MPLAPIDSMTSSGSAYACSMTSASSSTAEDGAVLFSRDFAEGFKPEDTGSWPRSLAGVDLLIAGEAFSEFGARIGGIVSCSARAEVNVIRREDGSIVVYDHLAKLHRRGSLDRPDGGLVAATEPDAGP